MNEENAPKGAPQVSRQTASSLAYETEGGPQAGPERRRFDVKRVRRLRKVSRELDAILGMHRYRHGGRRSA